MCGRSRPLSSGHACTQPCHSPASCDLSIACGARVTQRCACGRREQQAVCSASSSSPSSKAAVVLKCSDDCHKAARNERLALALGISPDRADRTGVVEWSAELQAQGLSLGSSFVGLVEKALGEFVNGPRATQILPHMPLGRREFVCKLAEAYRVDTSLVDQEPSRSVQLRRRVDSRVPTATALLSAAISASQAPSTTRSRLNTSRPILTATSTGPPAWGAAAAGSSASSAARPAPLVAPVPRSWGTVPSARASASATPTVSRTGSPYVPPGRRADDGPSAPAPGPTSAAPAPAVPAPAPVAPASAAAAGPTAAPAEVDDTWEQSDDEA
jgi:transcriptional repressor NF-X1